MTTKPKTLKASAVTPNGINPKLIALAAKLEKANVLAEERDSYDAVFELEDRLVAMPGTNLEEMKLKARYVNVDCIHDEQIGKLPASIIRDLLALNRKQKPSASGSKRGHHA
jgi:hypothetical protein